MKALFSFHWRMLFERRRVLLLGGLSLLSLLFYLVSSRPFDDAPARIIDRGVYARDYFFAALFFLRFGALFLAATAVNALHAQEGLDIVLFARKKRAEVFFARLAVAFVLIGGYLSAHFILMVAIHAFSPFHRAFLFPWGLIPLLWAQALIVTLSFTLAVLLGRGAFAYLIVIPGHLAADFLLELPVQRSATAPVVYVLHGFFPGIHLHADGAFRFLSSSSWLVWAVFVLFTAAFIIHRRRDV